MNRLSRDWEGGGVAAACALLAPDHQGSGMAAEYVPGLGYLVEDLIRCHSAKSQYISSAMGRILPEAALRAAPMMADSEMGVLVNLGPCRIPVEVLGAAVHAAQLPRPRP